MTRKSGSPHQASVTNWVIALCRSGPRQITGWSSLDEPAHREPPHAVGVGRHDGVAEHHRLDRRGDHLRDREAVDVGVEDADAVPEPREADREVHRDGGLAHAAFARADARAPASGPPARGTAPPSARGRVRGPGPRRRPCARAARGARPRTSSSPMGTTSTSTRPAPSASAAAAILVRSSSTVGHVAIGTRSSTVTPRRVGVTSPSIPTSPKVRSSCGSTTDSIAARRSPATSRRHLSVAPKRSRAGA